MSKCLECGKDFQGLRVIQKYCSRECQVRNYNRSRVVRARELKRRNEK